MASLLWLIPALPLAAAAFGALTPRRGRARAAAAALVAMAGSLALSGLALREALASPARHACANFTWFDLGRGAVQLGWVLDPLGALTAVMVCLVGTAVLVFSLGYMKDDPNFARFFCFMSLFAGAMLALLLANSLLLFFIAWEIVGLASYLLIGFWFHRPEAAAAAKKAFLTTRIGDLGLLLGILWLHRAAGTLLLYNGGAGCLEAGPLGALSGHLLPGGLALSTAIGLLLFGGAIGKSGQFPLHVWLPDAMEGPTPVSALIHAATMVAAGVFLVARVFPLLAADSALAGASVHALTVVAGIGAVTALLGAAIAAAQNDLKRILAYSTVSQLGYMMLALGVGSWVAAIFHLLTHAFFKALLFLGAGSVIHGAGHEQDIRRLGGLAGPMRLTFATFAIGAMSLCGVPFLFAGFWSKEAILRAAADWGAAAGQPPHALAALPLLAGLAGVVLTAFYMTRLTAEVFLGRPRSDASTYARESSAVLTVPLVILAIGAVGLGFLGTPSWPWLQSVLAGHQSAMPNHAHGDGWLTTVSILLVAVGLGAGWALYGRRPRRTESAPDPARRMAPGLFGFLGARMKFDELYARTFGSLVRVAAFAADALDRWVWGGLVAFAAQFASFSGLLDREADEEGFNAGFDAASDGLRGAGLAYSRAQTGQIQGYLRAAAIAFVLLVLASIFLGRRADECPVPPDHPAWSEQAGSPLPERSRF